METLLHQEGKEIQLLIIHEILFSLQQLQEELNENLFDNLVDFLQKSHSEFQKNSGNWGSQMRLREIPTAALILGMYAYLCIFLRLVLLLILVGNILF